MISENVQQTHKLAKDLADSTTVVESGKEAKEAVVIGLIYYEAYKSLIDAVEREKQLKIHGKAFGQLKRRINNSILN